MAGAALGWHASVTTRSGASVTVTDDRAVSSAGVESPSAHEAVAVFVRTCVPAASAGSMRSW